MGSAKHKTLHLPGGAISVLCDGSVVKARGIRYARAARFQQPEMVRAWDGVQDCTKPAPICPQNPSGLTAVTGELGRGRAQDEDCLRVTVSAPASARAAPVMVFLHGGGYATGGGDLDALSPDALASQGLVAVTVTYRLGVLGYLPIDDVAPANLGLLDQVESLKWVQENIEAFGGDAANVTVFGQSAGADSVYCLLVADGTDLLFRRAILQSPPLGRLDDEDRDAATRAMSQHAGSVLATQTPAAVSASSLLRLQQDLIGIAWTHSLALLPFAPIFGEYPLPAKSQALSRFISRARQTPVFIGHTANEETAFKHIDSGGETSTYLRHLFRGAIDTLLHKVEEELDRRLPSYEVVWHPAGSDNLKATHCIELPFLLGSWAAWKDAPMLQGPDIQDAVETVGLSVRNLWTAFAKGEDFGATRFRITGDFCFP